MRVARLVGRRVLHGQASAAACRVCALAAGESSSGAVSVADDRGRRRVGGGLLVAAGGGDRQDNGRRRRPGFRASRESPGFLHFAQISPCGCGRRARRRVSSTMTLRWSRTTLSDRERASEDARRWPRRSRDRRPERLVVERVLDEQLQVGDRHRLVERDERAAVRHVAAARRRSAFSSVRLGLTTITEWRPNVVSSAGGCGRSASIGCATRTMARLKSASSAASASMTSFGSVSVTGRDGRSNLRGRPRRGDKDSVIGCIRKLRLREAVQVGRGVPTI